VSERQTVLGDEPSPFANHRVVRKPLLSATTLAAWFTCHTRPFLQRVVEKLGLDTTTWAMRQGAAAHEQVQGALEAVAAPTTQTLPQALLKRSFLMVNELHLVDERRRLHGYADIVYAKDGRLSILELKNSRPPGGLDPVWKAPVRTEHGIQLHTYGTIAHGQFGQSPRLFVSYMAGSKKGLLSELESSRDPGAALANFEKQSVLLSHTITQRTIILNESRAFFRAEHGLDAPRPNHSDPVQCKFCGVNRWCPVRMDRPGEFVPLDPAGLEDRP
jgi:hypothetical protein